MKKIYYIVIFAILAGCNKNDINMGSIVGYVEDEISSNAIPSAEITIDRLKISTTSDSNGEFSFASIDAGSYLIVVSKEGYHEEQKWVTVAAETERNVEFLLKRQLPEISNNDVSLSIDKLEEAVNIVNPGDADLSLNIFTNNDWIELDQTSLSLKPLEEKSILISVDTAGMEFGSYQGNVYVNYDGYTESINVSFDYPNLDALVWQNWYLSVPINNGSGGATSIFYQDIVNNNLTPEEKTYFWYDGATASYVMWTKFTGYTTSGEYPLNGGAYCRTELREFWQGNQTTEDNWFFDDGYHKMESTLKVDYVEGVRETFVAQIHGKYSTDPTEDNSPATIKVKWASGMLRLSYYVKPPDDIWTSAHEESLNIGQVDYEKFTITLLIDQGVFYYALSCPKKNIDINLTEIYDYKTNGYHYDNYFKTGNYFKFNADYTQSAQVRLYEVKTEHY